MSSIWCFTSTLKSKYSLSSSIQSLQSFRSSNLFRLYYDESILAHTFNSTTGPRERGLSIVWWIHPEEDNNPRNLKKYAPWWRSRRLTNSYNNMEMNILEEEGKRREVHFFADKEGLIKELLRLDKVYDMSDNNFYAPKWQDNRENNNSTSKNNV